MSLSPDINPVSNIKSQISPTVDSKREEFRKYFENSGCPDVWTKILKKIYEKEEKPADPLNYFTETLGAINFDAREIIALKTEIQELKATVETLEKENTFLREKLEKVSGV